MNNTILPGAPVFPVTAPTSPTAPTGAEVPEGGFASTLNSAISKVEQLHQDSQSEVSDMLAGNRQDIHNVMIAVEKADVAFQLMMQVRNKIVNAYQEVSKLQF